MQIDFISELVDLLKEENFHVAIDTSGNINTTKAFDTLSKTDLVLLDIKSFDEDSYKKITGAKLAPALQTLEYLGQNNINTWIRFVLVPGLTDDLEMIEKLSKHLSQFNNISKIEVLPFHKMGEYKWQELGLDYTLNYTQEPKDSTVITVQELFLKYNNPPLD